MSTTNLNILLADDDTDDCELFEAAINELPHSIDLTIVNNGKQLIDHLNFTKSLPDLLFLDINMPLKNGLECLLEIRQNPKLNDLNIIVFSTTIAGHTLDNLYDYGVQYYLCKPDLFSELKKSLEKIITLSTQQFLTYKNRKLIQLSREDFTMGFSNKFQK